MLQGVGRLALHWQILIALVLAVGLGLLGSDQTAIFGVKLLAIADFIGHLFLRALTMLIVPLITASIIIAVAGFGETGKLGRLGLISAAYYTVTSIVAILIGLMVVQLVRPGYVDGQPAKDLIGLSGDVEKVAEQVSGRSGKDVVDIFLRLIPDNIVGAAAEGQILGLITFALLFGLILGRLEGEPARVMKNFWEALYQIMLRMTEWVLKLAPIGVFALVLKVVLATGFGAFRPLLAFAFCVLLALGIHFFVFLGLVLRFLVRVNPVRHYRAMAPALLMAFSTASSSASLPITMDCVRKRAGVSPRVTNFTLPLGAAINMDGTALYECVAAMFIAQAYGIELTFFQQFIVVATALITSIGVAGIPAASLVAISLILSVIGLPVEAIGLILAVDRVLDMCRTAVNVFSDTCGSLLIARIEGEEVLTEEHLSRDVTS